MEQISENPYYQHFIGLPGFQNEQPFVPSLLVEFRRRLNDEIMIEINEMIIAYNALNDSVESSVESINSETIILDATCAPQNVSD